MTVRTNNLSNQAGTKPPAVTLGEFLGARSTLTVSGGTPTSSSGQNISSVTDNGSGDFTFNFTTAFANANISVAAIGRRAITNDFDFVAFKQSTAPTASAIRLVNITDTTPTVADPERMTVIFAGDYA